EDVVGRLAAAARPGIGHRQLDRREEGRLQRRGTVADAFAEDEEGAALILEEEVARVDGAVRQPGRVQRPERRRDARQDVADRRLLAERRRRLLERGGKPAAARRAVDDGVLPPPGRRPEDRRAGERDEGVPG